MLGWWSFGRIALHTQSTMSTARDLYSWNVLWLNWDTRSSDGSGSLFMNPWPRFYVPIFMFGVCLCHLCSYKHDHFLHSPNNIKLAMTSYIQWQSSTCSAIHHASVASYMCVCHIIYTCSWCNCKQGANVTEHNIQRHNASVGVFMSELVIVHRFFSRRLCSTHILSFSASICHHTFRRPIINL